MNLENGKERIKSMEWKNLTDNFTNYLQIGFRLNLSPTQSLRISI